MKTLVKLVIFLFFLSISGCFNMYNEADEDMGAEYKYFLTAANNPSFISTFSINSEGVVNPVFKSSTFSAASGYYPAAHPNGNYLYVPDRANDQLYIYRINNDSSLTSLANIGTGDSPYAVKVHPSGKYVYVSNSGTPGSISMYQVNNDGTLTQIGSQIATTTNYRPFKMAFHPSGNFLYTTLIYPGNNTGFQSFTVNSTSGILSSLESVALGVSTPNLPDIIIHPNGQYLYLSIGDDNAYKYRLQSDGKIITPNVSYVVGAEACYFAFHPTGNYLFVASLNFVRAFSVNLTDGSLAQISDLLITNHRDIVVHPSGKYLFTNNYGSNLLYLININSNGIISLTDTIDYTASGYLSNPTGLAIIRKKIE